MNSKIGDTEAVIVSYRRTPFGRAVKGTLAHERPEDLALTAISGALADVPTVDPNKFDDFILGTAVPEGAQGDNAARRIAVYGGWDQLPATTVNRFCASSLEALIMAARAIRSGDGQAYLVGGMESTSSTPPIPRNTYPAYQAAEIRARERFESDALWVDPRERSLVPDVYIPMGMTAEFVARLTDTTRAEQDEWALLSQQRAARAIESGYFADELAPHRRLDGSLVHSDDCPRTLTTLENLEGLSAAFKAGGTVTAGNASPLSDGASAAVIMSARAAKEAGLTPLARILGATSSALSPEIMGLGPIGATNKLLARLGLTIGDIDLVELNEAFAAQVIPVVRKIGADPEKVNVNGGAIALGHPFGATGIRLAGTVTRSLKSRDGTLGLATLCVGGGQGVAMALERLS